MSKPKTLPRELAKPISQKEATAVALGAINSDPAAAVAKWLARVRSEKLLMLLHHYQLERADPVAFHKLALALAIDYVPGFTVEKRRRGRPSKGISLAQISRSMQTTRKTGRTKTWFWHGREHQLLSLLEQGRGLLKQRGEKITNEAALFAAFRKHAALKAFSDRTIRSWARGEAKRLSDARKALRKSEAN